MLDTVGELVVPVRHAELDRALAVPGVEVEFGLIVLLLTSPKYLAA